MTSTGETTNINFLTEKYSIQSLIIKSMIKNKKHQRLIIFQFLWDT